MHVYATAYGERACVRADERICTKCYARSERCYFYAHVLCFMSLSFPDRGVALCLFPDDAIPRYLRVDCVLHAHVRRYAARKDAQRTRVHDERTACAA